MTRIGAVVIGVTDVEKGAAFYEAALGLRVARALDPGLALLEHAAGLDVLLQRAEAPARVEYPREAQTLAVFYVDDLRAAMARLRAAGAELLHDAPQPAPVGEFVGFRDPWGNAHEALQLAQGEE